MTFSNVVMFAIIVATGSTIAAQGPQTISTASEAAKALQPVAGSMATVLFALGFIAAGFLAVPVLAGSGSAALSGLFGRRWGYSESLGQARLFYVLVVGATVGASALSLLGVNAIALLVVVAVVNGVLAAPFVAIVMLISGDRTVMGAHRNGRLAKTLGWATFGLMAVAALGLVYSQAVGG
jgi:Mn2+/Fe2+ NRAMP family transporter